MAPRTRESTRTSPPAQGSSREAGRPVSEGAGKGNSPSREDGDGDTEMIPPAPPPRHWTLPSNDDESDTPSVDDSGVFSTRFIIVDKLKANLSDGFEPSLDGQPQGFDGLLRQFNAYLKFADSVLRVCDMAGRRSQGRLTATEAEMITLAIMLKLGLTGRQGWVGQRDQQGNPDKRLVMEASRTESEMMQALWKVELVTPEACIAKIHSMYSLYVVKEDMRETFNFNRIYEEHMKVPFHHRMHNVLIPLCQLGTWETVRLAGSARIRKFMEENPNDWWEIPPPQFHYQWSETVDRSINFTPVERRIPYFGIGTEESGLTLEGLVPSQNPVALNTMQSGDSQRNSGNWRPNKRRNGGVQNDDRQGNGKRPRRPQNQQNRAPQVRSQVAKSIVDRNIQCRKCKGFGHKQAQCPSMTKAKEGFFKKK